jgi:hypothetical protein
MEIITRVVGGKYIEVTAKTCAVDIDLGLMDTNEALDLLNHLKTAVTDLEEFINNH